MDSGHQSQAMRQGEVDSCTLRIELMVRHLPHVHPDSVFTNHLIPKQPDPMVFCVVEISPLPVYSTLNSLAEISLHTMYIAVQIP